MIWPRLKVLAEGYRVSIGMNGALKVLLADDHALFREGLRMVLEELGNGPITVIEASSFNQALDVTQQTPDLALVLLDLSMPDMDGLSGVQTFRRAAPRVPVVVLTANDDPRTMKRALEHGARGYITKSSSTQIMRDGIAAVLRGETFVTPSLSLARERNGEGPARLLDKLTPRQVDVLAMIRQGKSNKEIGRELNLAEITVKMHVTAILKVLAVQNRTQAAILAEQIGL